MDATTVLQISPDNGSSFVLAPYQPQFLSFSVPRSGNENGFWDYGVVTADFDDPAGTSPTIVVFTPSQGYGPPFPYLGQPPPYQPSYSGGIDAPTTEAGYGTFKYPLGVQSFGQTDTYSNVILTLYPFPLPTAYATAGKQVNSSHSACKNSSYAPTWYVQEVAAASVADSLGNTYAVTPPDQVGQYLGDYEISLPAQTITADISYTLTATGHGGETVTSTISVSVIPFSVTLTGQAPSDPTQSGSVAVEVGQSVVLDWSAVGAMDVNFYAQVIPASGSPKSPVLFSSYQIGEYGGGKFQQINPPNGTLTVKLNQKTIYTAVADSSYTCGKVTSGPVTVTVTYPPDGSTATGIISAVGGDGGRTLPGGGGGASAVPPTGALEVDHVRQWLHQGVNAAGKSSVLTTHIAGEIAFSGPALQDASGHGIDQWVRFRTDPRGGKLLLLGLRAVTATISAPTSTQFTVFLSTDGGLTAAQVLSMAASTALIEVLSERGLVVLMSADTKNPPNISTALGNYQATVLVFAAAVPAMNGSGGNAKQLTGTLMDMDYDARTDTLFLLTDSGPLRSKDCGLTWNA